MAILHLVRSAPAAAIHERQPVQRRLQQRSAGLQQRRPQALLSRLFPLAAPASADLLAAVDGSQRGLVPKNKQQILEAVEQLAGQGRGTVRSMIEPAILPMADADANPGPTNSLTQNDASKVSGTWKLLWTTEKETLWILKNAGLFGTQGGDVYQVRAAGAHMAAAWQPYHHTLTACGCLCLPHLLQGCGCRRQHAAERYNVSTRGSVCGG